MSKLGEKVRMLSDLADKSVSKASAAEEESVESRGAYKTCKQRLRT